MFFFRERPTANLSIIDDKLMLNKDIYIYIYIYILWQVFLKDLFKFPPKLLSLIK